MSVLGTYIKYLREIKMKVFYDEDECVNPLKVKFPNLSRGEEYGERADILDKIECLEIEKGNEYEDLYRKYDDIIDDLKKRISVKYFKRNMKYFSVFKEKEILSFSDSDSDSDPGYDFNSYSDIDSYLHYFPVLEL